MEVLFNNSVIFKPSTWNLEEIHDEIKFHLGLKLEDYYLIHNGKRTQASNTYDNGRFHVILRLVGGKGGFGSMLRAIGAQIEKTTNREACRDLSGRRLRDINEEQRLKNWIASQADREKETAERKKKKLEKLCREPKHEFKDEEYDKERSVLPEKVEDSVTEGLKAAGSSKRKIEEEKPIIKKKKPKLWFDEEDLSCSDDSSDDEEKEEKSPTFAEDSTIVKN